MLFMLFVIIIATVLQIAIFSVFIGAGVYYLAEYVEEHTMLTKQIIQWTIRVVIICEIGLYLFDNVPITVVTFGIIGHLMYYILIANFPYFNLTSLAFIFSIILLVFNHVMAFKFFQQRYTTLLEVFSYFIVCLWIVPFMLIVSLTANDNILPVTNVDVNTISHYFANQNNNYKLKNIFSYFGEMTGKNNHLK